SARPEPTRPPALVPPLPRFSTQIALRSFSSRFSCAVPVSFALCMKDYQMNDTRSKWLRSALGTVAAWWSFWICFVVLLVITIGIADAIIPGDGLSLLPGSVLALISLAVAVLGAIRFVRYQDRYMGGKSLKANYLVLGIVILVSILFMPLPFFFTIF
ncbi:MAG: hypothetical protein J5I99_06580, partial [Verrucomicrobia bacterium]|nr:hypothetical protein [Verrucomicrobiota bacterium]